MHDAWSVFFTRMTTVIILSFNPLNSKNEQNVNSPVQYLYPAKQMGNENTDNLQQGDSIFDVKPNSPN